MSETKTPRTDAALDGWTDRIVEQSRMIPADAYAVLRDAARKLETELAAEQQARVSAETELRAWHSIFGTTQLSHARAGFEAAEERAHRNEQRAVAAERERDEAQHQLNLAFDTDLVLRAQVEQEAELMRVEQRATAAEARAQELEKALKQFADCDLNESNCDGLATATKRIRNIARAAIDAAQRKEGV